MLDIKLLDQLDAVPTVDFGLTKESYKEGKKDMTNYSYHSMH
jgi:hypothetical protein